VVLNRELYRRKIAHARGGVHRAFLKAGHRDRVQYEACCRDETTFARLTMDDSNESLFRRASILIDLLAVIKISRHSSATRSAASTAIAVRVAYYRMCCAVRACAHDSFIKQLIDRGAKLRAWKIGDARNATRAAAGRRCSLHRAAALLHYVRRYLVHGSAVGKRTIRPVNVNQLRRRDRALDTYRGEHYGDTRDRALCGSCARRTASLSTSGASTSVYMPVE